MPEKPLKVMQIITNLEIGGAQEVVHTLAKYLSRNDDCQAIVVTFADGPLREKIEKLGVPVEVLPARRYKVSNLPMFMMDMVGIFRSLREIVKRHQIDVIQTHLLRSLDFLMLFLLYTTSVQAVLWTFHNTNYQHELIKYNQQAKIKWLGHLKVNSHRWLYRSTARLVSGFVAISEDVRQSMIKGIGPIGQRITTIANGVDVERYQQQVDRKAVRAELGLPEEAQVVAMVALFREQKGHRFLVEAMETLSTKHPDLHILLIGDGDLRPAVETQVATANLGHCIHFLGNRPDVPDLLAASNIFVLPSLWEGLPMAVLEAMATGLSVVVSDLAGTRKIVTPDKTGIIIEPGNSKMLANALDQILSTPTKAEALGQAAQTWVEEVYSARKQANDHIALYRRLLAEG